MKSREIISNILQVLLGIVSSVLLGLFVTYYGWSFVINVSQMVGNLGYKIDLVGEPGTTDPGAVIVAGLYLLPIVLISYFLIKKTKYKVLGAAFCVSAIFMAVTVFTLVSSLIWF